MASIGINVYSFQIFGSDAKPVELHNIVNGKNLLELVKEYIEQNISTYVDSQKQETIYKFVDWKIVKKIAFSSNEYLTYLYGKVKTGNYGIETEIVNKKTQKTTHIKTSDEAELIPFHFLIVLPKNECSHTVVLLQTQGIYGMKKVFEHEFDKFIHNINIKLKVSFGPLYPKEFLEKYLKQGCLKKLTLYRYDIPKDEADKYGINRGSKRVQQIISISSSGGFTHKKIEEIKECIHGKRAYNTLVELGFAEYDDLKLEFKFGNKRKIFSLKNLDKVIINEDITNSVELVGGNPTTESILPIMSQNAIEYLIEMGLVEKIDELIDETLSEFDKDGDMNEMVRIKHS